MPGVTRRFASPVLHEAVLSLPMPVGGLLESLRIGGVLGGYELAQDYPELADSVLARHSKGTDDALVLVARYLGGSP